MNPFVRLAASVALGATLLVPASSVRATDILIPGKIVIIKDAKLTKMVAKPTTTFPVPAPAGAGDPTAAGGSLSVTDLGDSQGLSTALPAAGWKGLGNPAGSKGYKYKGAGSGGDPCKIVLVKEKVIKFVCKDDQNLDPPLAGAAAIELALGTDNYCAEFGGQEVKNIAGLTKRKDAVAPAGCGGGGSTTTSVTTTSSTTSSTFGPCCGGLSHGVFTSGVAGGNCGVVKNADGTTYTFAGDPTVVCGGLYTGGGNNGYPLPEITPDLGQSVVELTSCAVQTATVGPTTSAETGNIRTCTSPGCLFGGPLPIINPASIPTSICVINVVNSPASGTVDCGLGTQSITVPLDSLLFLTGDTATDPSDTIPGTQPCPLCSGGTCIGGPNNGMTCTADNTNQGGLAQYPSSHDCPPDPMLAVGTIPVSLLLSTGSMTWTGTVATNDTGNTVSTQTRVFCGYCRDRNGTGCFKGDPNALCPPSTPGFQQCWENGTAVNPGTPCTEPFESCEQQDHGAFGPGGGAVKTITVFGTPAGNTFDGAPHAAKVAGNFCIAPTFDPVVDASGNLPGPGATALNGVTELCASANPCPDGP
jgi:hypothetical protein